MELPALIEALSRPESYSFPVTKVEVRQTHISAVFLIDSFVYKVKKPVSMSFLDFSTLEKRLEFCLREVTLNRRLAPNVYLGVVPIVADAAGVHVEGRGTAIEWAVKMKRLPNSSTLQDRVMRGEVDEDLVRALARRIADFHREAESSERIATFGRFDRVARTLRDVFDQSASQVGHTVSRTVCERVRSLIDDNLEHLRPLIDRRAAIGFTRDTHGDMHLDHIYYFPEQAPPGQLVIIDCIEFNEHFRFIDVVADMAFPAMDLAFMGRRDLARVFADAYFEATGDDDGRALLPLYTAYRATVRGTVEGLLLEQKEVSEVEKTNALQRARAHWLLALTELESPARRPCLLLVGGLPGSGKSTLARGLAERAGFAVVRSDVTRKALAGLSLDEPTPVDTRAALYSPEWNDRTYAECLRRAEGMLFEGRRVLIDASFIDEERRRAFLGAAVRRGVPGLLLICQAQPEVIRLRLQNRRDDASDADWSVYEIAARNWKEISPETMRLVEYIQNDGNPDKTIDLACRALAARGIG
jgi:uncharacterized protein